MFLPEPQITTGLPRIKIIGIGGAGIHIISAIATRELPVDLIAMDSSSAVLEEVAPMRTVRLGPSTTRGLGCGASVEAGAQAAHASRAEITDAVAGAELLLLVAGLGGGVGSGAIRIVADIAAQMNIPTICFVTKPFRFEGLKRTSIANAVLADLEREAQGVLSIEHDKLQENFPKDISLVDAMNVGSQYLQQIIEQLLHVIQVNALINIDFADILSLFRTHGKFALGTVKDTGGVNIKDLVHQAIHHPLTSIADKYSATGVMVFTEAGEDFDLDNLGQATEFIDEICNEDTQVIFGMNSLPGNQPLTITVLATGITPAIKNDIPVLPFTVRGRSSW